MGKKNIFDNINYDKSSSNVVNNLPLYKPENFQGNLDLSSSSLEEGVPSSLIGEQDSAQYLDELKAQRQGFLDKAANGTVQALNTAVVGTIGNTAGVLHGLSNLSMGQSFFDNPTFKFMDEWDKSVQEALPLYRSKQEQNGSVADKVLDKDFFFGDLLQGVGFVGSSLIPGAGWAKLGKTARTVLLASRTAKLEQMVTSGNIASKEFIALSKFVDTANKTIEGTSNLAAATFGRIYESRLEAKGVYDETYNKSYDKKLQELKGTLSDEEAIGQADQYATKQATDARNFTFGANMLLAIPDYFQYGKIFNSFGNKTNIVSKINRNSLTGLAEEEGKQVLNQVPKSFGGKVSNTLGKIVGNSKVQTAIIEAGEEGTQYNIGETAKKLAENDIDFSIKNLTKEFINQSIHNISSPEFITSALSGAVIGGGMSLLHNNEKQDKNARESNTKTAIQNLNEYAPLLKKTQVAQNNINKYTQLEKEKTDIIDYINNPNTTEENKVKARSHYRQLDNLQFTQAVQAHIEANTLDTFLDEIDLFGSSSKEQLSNDFGIETFEYNEDGTEITSKEIAKKKIQRAKGLAAAYQQIQSNYNNLSQPSRNELFNITSTLNYNDEKLDLVNGKITKLELDKSNAELTDKPFNPEKSDNLSKLKQEKQDLIETQQQLGKRHEKLRTGKAEDREVKTESDEPISKDSINNTIENTKSNKVPTNDVIETITSDPEGKFKGNDIEILDNKGDRVSFKVKGNNTIVKLSKEEFNKQVLGQTNKTKQENKEVTSTGEVILPNKSKKEDNDLIVDTDEYEVGGIKLSTNENKQVLENKELSKNRKDLGTKSFFNSPLFFINNGITDKRNEILSNPDWKDKFRIIANKNYAKSNPKASIAYNNGKVDVYTNGGENALDLTIEYNDSIDPTKPNWVSYGSLPYSGMLRDSKGKPFDFSTMSYNDFIDKFYIANILDSNGIEQTIEFTPNQFNFLKIEQQKFNEFETLVKQYYNNSNEEVLPLSNDIINSRISYFVNNGESALIDLSTIQGFNNAKILTISDGKINKDLTTTDSRIQVPEYLIDTFGTSNKTFINIQLENGTNFWTIGYIKGDNKKVESEVVTNLTNLALSYNSKQVTPETDNEVQEIIKDLNSKVFIQNNLENYLNFRAFPLDSNTGYKIKIQLKTDTGSEYIDIFNPDTTVKADGERLTEKELANYFNFDNLSNLINNGFKEYSININPNSFIANNTKGNPKLEDLTIPIKSIDFNIKFDYNTNELPTLKSSTTLDKSINPSIDDDIEKEIEEQKLKLQDKKKTDFSRILNNEILPLNGNEDTYRKYNLLNKEGKIKSVDPNSKSIKEWVKSNNNSPYYNFVIKQASDSKFKIFIKEKALYSNTLDNNSNTVGLQYLTDISSKIKEQYSLIINIEPVFDNSGRPVKGKFENGIVYINPQYATQDTPIHEVIHPFIELVKQNNTSLYNNLISELKKSGIGKRIIETVNNNYSNLSQQDLLDESLVTLMGYYSSGVISKTEDRNLLESLKAFFRKVSLYIKNIFNKDLDPSTISSTSTIAELSDIVVSNKINLNSVEINNPKEAKLNLLSANDSIKLINTIGAKTVERIKEKPTKDNLDSIISSIIEQTKIENNTRNIDANNIEDLDERKAYKLKRHLISESLTIPENIEAIKKSITQDILKMYYSEEDKYSQDDDIVQNVNDEADIKDYEEGVENSGGWNNVSPEIRNFIYYNSFTYIDEAGYEVTEAVDGLQVYKQIQTALADQQSKDFLPILESLSKYNIQLKSILDNFKIKTGLDSKGEKTLSQSNFYNKFFKTFENTKLEYLQVFQNKKNGEFIVNSSNKSTTAGRLFNRWKNNLIVNKDSLKVNADKLQKTINSIGSEVLVNPIQIVNELYNGLNSIGLEVSKPYLEYSFIKESNLAVYENQGVTKLDLDTINKLLSTIKKGNDIFEGADKKGNTNILYKVAQSDAIFRADAIEDTYRDSRGKLRNSYTKQNLVTKKIADWKNRVKDINFIKDIKEDKNNYYHYNYLFNNKLFTSIEQIQEVFKNADLALIGDIRDGNDKFTTRNISSEAFSKMQLSFYRNSTEPKDIVDNSNFPFEARTNSRQKFVFIDFGKISDKNTELALRLPIDNRFSKDGGFTDWFIDQIYNTVFLQEYTKLKSYDNKGKLYYSKTEPLYLNDSILKEIKSGNAWSNLSVLNNSIIEEYSNKYNKPKFLELKNLLTIDDLSTKKELIKEYLTNSFTYNFQEYLNNLTKQDLINDKSDITELGNMYANNFILRTSFQQLVKGDLAISKNNEDDIKRNGRVTAYGESGRDFNEGTNTTYKVLYLTDAVRYKVKEDNNFRAATEEEIKLYKEGKSTLDIIKLDSDDAGARMTVKHLIDTLQRLGRLDDKTLQSLNKIDSGEELTSYERNLVDLIPMKGVHAGVNTYLKMSQFTLIKQFTSIKDKQGNWIARRGREQLHNLRELMENNSIGLAIPKSGSKSISKPLFNQDNLIESSIHDTTDNTEDIDWSDWRLQVENESGKTEISQPVQIIQMIDGSNKISQEIKDKLQDLYVEQREGNFNDALNIAEGNTEYGKQLLIDKFQDNAINSASDANTLEYLTGENNEFNYSPNLPHITFTFENYYTSHFNKNVLAQKVPGYKCTLAPATGIKVLRDTKTGEIILSDTYENNKKDYVSKQYQDSDLRIHSGISPYAECLMTKAQAEKLGLTIGESISEDIFKMIGTRLPCQGYSSMIPLKIVDFLPECYGSTIIAPEEIVYIAGSDYDVDSLFIMRKEAYKDEQNNIRYYTYNEKDNNLRWNDYKKYLTTGNKNIVSKIREDNKDNTLNNSVEEVLKAFGYPTNLEEFLTKEKELGKLLNSKYAVTNELVNTYEDILTNPILLKELQQPVDNADLDKVGKTIYFDLQGQGSKVNYFHNSDIALKKHFELATQGKRDVGSAANGNSVSSFFKKHKIILKDKYHFTFNNTPVTNLYGDNVIDFDFIYDKQGKLVLDEFGIPLTSDIKEVAKQDVHSGLMSITVDNGKDPVCFMLNLDPANVSIASTMIHLGIGGKGFIGTFMNTEIVKYSIPSSFYRSKVAYNYIDIGINIIDKEMLIRSMMGKSTGDEEYCIALLFERLKKISGTTSNVSKLIATNKGIGSTFEDLDNILKAKEELDTPNLNVFANLDKAIKDNKNISFNLKAINTIDNNILSKEFLSRSSFISNLKHFLSKTTLPDIQLDKEFNGYLISSILKHNRNIDFKQASALCLPNNENSIVSKYFDLVGKYPEFKNNILIKFLTVERGNSTKADLLYFNQSIKLNGKSLEKLTDGYRELIQSDNEEVSNFAKDMFYYLIVKDNMKFTINSFGRLLAPEMFKKLSSELRIATQGIIEENNDKLVSIIGKTYKELSNEFIQNYVRWIGNTDKFINYHYKKLNQSGISSKRSKDDRDLLLNFDINKLDPNKDILFDTYQEGNTTFIDYPDFIKSGTSIYHLKEQDGLNGRYEVISYIGLPIMSPYHLDLETNERLYHERKKYLGISEPIDNSEEANLPDIDIVTSFIDNSNAESPQEYQDEPHETTNDIFGIVDKEPTIEYNNIIEQTTQEEQKYIDNIKPSKVSDTLQEAVDQNITQYVEHFYYSLNAQEKSKLANRGIPRLYTPTDITKDYNKSKDLYNNDFNKYLEYLRNCRL